MPKIGFKSVKTSQRAIIGLVLTVVSSGWVVWAMQCAYALFIRQSKAQDGFKAEIITDQQKEKQGRKTSSGTSRGCRFV
ncbi:hypothetical protein F5Y03DRAFT_380230, partial [Xylaria venustula]